ncbi:ABC transporter permease [Planomonospora venezuelensis]|uniref:ABC-type transport system involved in multi-copper enzyme maturation permease subunit n=1 Tax=Planomonospora venezuelensis TaxID=1999 RepID=A0A841DHL3_PLAVE|nr:ABC transporter permease [Planomonospora venezuelensis]MBB5967585.1 ABC-type transport system involved in multi-copper enzyme maturation permease subunit [Planomonospora venezuelensis]GIN00237.1 ABC transporter permease [Planomonospora venezuelensis]
MTVPTAAVPTASPAAVLRSEWAKFRTTRATGYVLAGAFVIALCYAYLFGTANGRAYVGSSPGEQASFDPLETAFRSLALAQLLVSAVGVLAVTSEYAAGTMRTSVTVVPRRGRLLVGKAAVVTMIMLLCGPLITLGSFLISQTMLAAQGAPSASLTNPGVPGAIMGGGLYLTLIGLYGVAMGFLLRRTAGAVALGSFLLLLPASAPLFPEWLAEWAVRYWPSSAGMGMFSPAPSSGSLPPHMGFVLLATTVLALLTGASAVFRSRDV